MESIIENIKKQNLITEIELKEQLKKDNITYEDFVEGIRIERFEKQGPDTGNISGSKGYRCYAERLL